MNAMPITSPVADTARPYSCSPQRLSAHRPSALYPQSKHRPSLQGDITCRRDVSVGAGGGGPTGAITSATDFDPEDEGQQGAALAWATVLFATLVAVGGIMGYKKKGSKASLYASGAFAAVLLAAALLGRGASPAAGLALGFGASCALGAYMAKGYLATRKPFPQGVFTVVSAVYAILYGSALAKQA